MIPLETTKPDALPPFHVVVDFGKGIPSAVQGVVMLAMERELRDMDVPAEVFKRTMADDNKRRRDMTPEQREKL